MRQSGRLVLAILTLGLAACGDLNLDLTGPGGSLFGLGTPPRDLPAGSVRFEPRAVSLRIGESADVTLRLAPSLRSTVIQWWGSRAFPLVTVDDFACTPAGSCGMVSFMPAERAALQLEGGGSMRMRVTAIAAGQGSVVAWVNTCASVVSFCGDQGSDSLFVEVRP